jgi:hypothetical protein
MYAVMKGLGNAAQARHDESIALAWHIEAIGRSDPRKPLPSLKKLLARRVAAQSKQSPAEMLAVFQTYQAGGAPMTIRRIA